MLDILKHAFALCAVSALAAFAISFAHGKTAAAIDRQANRKLPEALAAIFPQHVTVRVVQGLPPLPADYWVAEKGATAVAYAFKINAAGYGGDIDGVVGIDTNGAILGLSILSQDETPGLGGRISEAQSHEYVWTHLFAPRQHDEPWFTRQFKGISAPGPIAVRPRTAEWYALTEAQRADLTAHNAVTAIAGATVSTRAVTSAIEKNARTFLAALKEAKTYGP